MLFEGLPHQMFEAELLDKERRTKAVQELSGYWFYQERLPLSQADSERLCAILPAPESFRPVDNLPKKCGGFHPDYAAEWLVGGERYRALICFGCHEIKLIGPGLDATYELNGSVPYDLENLLAGYQKNRPGKLAAARAQRLGPSK